MNEPQRGRGVKEREGKLNLVGQRWLSERGQCYNVVEACRKVEERQSIKRKKAVFVPHWWRWTLVRPLARRSVATGRVDRRRNQFKRTTKSAKRRQTKNVAVQRKVKTVKRKKMLENKITKKKLNTFEGCQFVAEFRSTFWNYLKNLWRWQTTHLHLINFGELGNRNKSRQIVWLAFDDWRTMMTFVWIARCWFEFKIVVNGDSCGI